MSTSLKPVDLTSAAIGQKFTLDFSPFVKFNPGSQPYQKAHLSLFNESGCGLQLTMIASGQGQYLPAGAWTTIDLEPNDNQLTMVVVYTLPNPPVSQLGVVYFLPGEEIHGNYTLGNSPIGIGGSVNTSNIQTLSQEGQAKTLLTIDIGDSALIQLITINNDGTATWKVDVAGVAHTVLQMLATANFLKIGQAGDTAEVLGKLTVDQATTLDNGNIVTDGAGNVLFANQKQIQEKDNVGTTRPILYVDASNITTLRSANGGIQLMNAGGTETDIQMDFATFINIGVAGRLTHVFGTLTVDQLLTASGGIAGPGASDFSIDSAGAGNIRLKQNGTLILSIVSGGIQLQSGSISLPDGGGISGMFAIGPFTIAQAGTSVTHNMGVKPTFVVPVHDTGGQNGDVITINFGTMNTTTFTAYTTNAAGSGNVRFLIYH